MDAATAPPAAIPALARMRRYTTISLCATLLIFIPIGIVPLDSPVLQVATAAVGLATIAMTAFWERTPPLWLSILTILGGVALWIATLVMREPPFSALLLAMPLALLVSQRPRHKLPWSAAGLAIVVLPVLALIVLRPTEQWMSWLLSGALFYLLSAGLHLLNRYGWSLYLEIDATRDTAAKLAVAQERYRFAADLHDIQGHTLHVIKLKTQLARKLVDRDPDAARQQLLEAEELISETLANTRSLAFGDRHVGLASELANARELFVAAGIGWNVTGNATPGQYDELFGLVVRETTTNILRHAQSTSVTVTIEPDRLVVSNDGSPETQRPPSGLARLGERFEQAGGTLRTTASAGTFTTEARIS